MKKFFSMLIILSLFLLSACTGGGGPGPDNNGGGEDTYEYVSLLSDKTFENGFVMRGLGAPIYNDPIESFGEKYDPGTLFQYGKAGAPAPSWYLQQWATRYPFHDTLNASPYLPEGKLDYAFTDLGGGSYRYDNTSKSITVDTNTGEYRLVLRSSECYKEPRAAGQEWPHWFPSQTFKNNALIPDLYSVAASQSLKIRFDMRVNAFTDGMGSAANPDLHSGIVVFYLTVYNRDPVTHAQTDMLWLGLCPFDNRYVLSSQQSFPDVGTKGSATGKWIFNVATAEYFTLDYNLKTTDNQIIFNEWRTADVEMLPWVDRALKEAQANGYMANAKWENLYIQSMYFGYESPGTYDMDMSFRNVDITSMLKV